MYQITIGLSSPKLQDYLTAEEFVTRSYANWQAFVTRALPDSHIFVFDGQLFHGDFTCLFLINSPPEILYQMVIAPLPALRLYSSTSTRRSAQREIRLPLNRTGSDALDQCALHEEVENQ